MNIISGLIAERMQEIEAGKYPSWVNLHPRLNQTFKKDRNTKAHEKIGSTSLYNLKNCIINIDLDPLD